MLTTDTSARVTGDELRALEARLDLEAETRLEAARAEAMARVAPALKAARPTALVAVVVGGILAVAAMGAYLIYAGDAQARLAQRTVEQELADERAALAAEEAGERQRIESEMAALRERLAAGEAAAARDKAAREAAAAARAKARAAKKSPKMAAAPAAAHAAPASVLDAGSEILGQ